MAIGLALLISACGGGDEGVSTGSAESEAKEVESVEAAQAEVTADVDQSEYTLKQPEGPPGIKVTSTSITSRCYLDAYGRNAVVDPQRGIDKCAFLRKMDGVYLPRE